jgi:SAM-dependent methyltransferase
MMFGMRDEFAYWECGTCGCLQIRNIPEHLEDYYPKNYYSFSQSLNAEDVWWYRAYFKAPQLGPIIRRIRKNPYFADGKFQSVVDAKPKRGARILDVGCGAGHLVSVLRSVGYDAHGIDAFATAETPYIRRCTLDAAADNWDLITFHHALEHMTDHVDVLRCARQKLAPGGTCLVRIPVAAWAWKQYGSNWVQLDAPRHLIVHTPESFRRAAGLAGLRTSLVKFDSTIFQIVGSELYKRDIPLNQIETERAKLTKETIRSYIAQTIQLNQQQLGDQASFYLKAVTS